MLYEVMPVLMEKFGTTLVTGAEMDSIDMYAEVYLRRQMAGGQAKAEGVPFAPTTPVLPAVVNACSDPHAARRCTTWQGDYLHIVLNSSDYGTDAMMASQSSGHGPPPQPPDSRLAHAPERAEPPPQPTDSRIADAHGRARPAPQQRRARRPRVLALAPLSCSK